MPPSPVPAECVAVGGLVARGRFRAGARLDGAADVSSAVILGWFMFRGGPSILDASMDVGAITQNRSLGDTPFFAAIFVVINIHHHFMDHVIWRRENPETKYLSKVR